MKIVLIGRRLTFLSIIIFQIIFSVSGSVVFNEDVSPILSRYCYECHGPDQQNVKGGLRLDNEEAMNRGGKSGKPLIIPGQPENSELFSRIISNNADFQMPPPEKGNPLKKAQVEKIKKWIQLGANYQMHWAYQPIVQPEIPKVNDVSWPVNPIDYFILKGLEKKNINPAPQAEKRVILRRVYLNLLGIPPSLEDMENYLSDKSEQAWMKVVDALLERHEYGQKWGRHWLDVVRYADSNGSDENHSYPYAHRYRNYIIDAFNNDLPFDQFILEQLAGDLLSNEKHSELKTATGFLAIGSKILAEQDPIKKLADTVDEQIDTFSKTFLAHTISCARCHDHKFDQIPTTDYYALAGIFHSSSIYDGKVKNLQFLKTENDFNIKIEHLRSELALVNSSISGKADEKFMSTVEAEKYTRGNVVIDNNNYGKGIGIISDQGGGDNYVEYDLINYSQGTYLLELRYAAKNSRPGQIKLNGIIVVKNALGNMTGGWKPEHQKWHREGILHLTGEGDTLRFESKPNMSHIDKWRITPLNGPKEEIELLLKKREALEGQFAELNKNAPVAPKVMAVMDSEPKNVNVHLRGDFNNLGDEVPRSAPLGSVFKLNVPVPDEASGRKQLAEWLAHPKNPITARVIVNRLWHWHFGKGIVDTPNNFGVKGSRPTHPKLLDYLSHKLIASGWSIKAIHREILNSRTYKMASGFRSEAAEKIDPNNKLLWRQFRRRMDAEIFRDSILAVAGKLDTRLGGGEMKVISADPSPKDMIKNRKFYEKSTRRSVYLPVVRSHIYDFFSLLDFPHSTISVGKRSDTTIPTQALMMMNSPFFIDQAENIATLIKEEDLHDIKLLISNLYRHVLSRPPSQKEYRWSAKFLSDILPGGYMNEVQLEALQALVHTLIVSDDFLYIQ